MDYPEYFARFYDLIYDRMRSHVDMDFYLKEVSSVKGKVLEIGSGTGRLFKQAIDAGADIYGIDISPGMTGILLKKLDPVFHDRVSIQGAADFRFPFRFDLIIAPFRVFSHLLTVDEQLKALNNIFDHLCGNGKLILDLYVPDPGMIASGINNVIDSEGEYEPGKKYSRTVNMKSDIVNQISDIIMTFRWIENNRERVEDWNFKFRYFFRYELEHLIARSKLRLERIYGDFDRGELKSDSKEFIMVCRK